MKRILIILLCAYCIQSCKKGNAQKTMNPIPNQPAKVELIQENGKFQLLVNKAPFYIKGAGLEFGDIPSLAKHQANSFRTWRTENGQKSGKEVLDEAYKNGLMVTMGIEVERERHGFDYDNAEEVSKQLERIRKEVLELKDHPALMIWAIGNELNHHSKNPKVWNAVNEISKMIHEVDPNHLTTTTLAGIAKKEIDLIKERANDIDILSVQMYGDLPNLPILIRDFGWTGAYMVTEWGATGHWEVPTTKWGAPVEENSTVKAANYMKRYKGGIEADTQQCIGSYVFLWGNKQERTPTWYGVFLEDGQETESVDVMHYIWNKKWPKNRTPQIASFALENKTAYESVTLISGQSSQALAVINDYEKDALSYKWEILPESEAKQEGGDHEERPKSIKGLFQNAEGGVLKFTAPTPGHYRLFVYADDGQGHAATANIPFKVK